MSGAPRLIGLSGYAQVGKDTFAAYLFEYDYILSSFADPVREMLYELNPTVDLTLGLTHTGVQNIVNAYGWERAKNDFPEVRRLLQALGTDAGRKLLGEDIWVDRAMAKVDAAEAAGMPGDWLPRFVFKDVRFPNEAQAIVDRGGIIVRIERPNHGPLNGHESETAMDDWEWDYVIRNTGSMGELRSRAGDLIAKESNTYKWPGLKAFAGWDTTLRQYPPEPFEADGWTFSMWTPPMDRIRVRRSELLEGDYSPGRNARITRIEPDTTRVAEEGQNGPRLYRDQVTVFWSNGDITTADAAAELEVLRQISPIRVVDGDGVPFAPTGVNVVAPWSDPNFPTVEQQQTIVLSATLPKTDSPYGFDRIARDMAQFYERHFIYEP